MYDSRQCTHKGNIWAPCKISVKSYQAHTRYWSASRLALQMNIVVCLCILDKLERCSKSRNWISSFMFASMSAWIQSAKYVRWNQPLQDDLRRCCWQMNCQVLSLRDPQPREIFRCSLAGMQSMSVRHQLVTMPRKRLISYDMTRQMLLTIKSVCNISWHGRATHHTTFWDMKSRLNVLNDWL